MNKQKTPKHFITSIDYTPEVIRKIINLAILVKKRKVKPSLARKVLAMLFFNPSLRTRLSFATAMAKLGGIAVDIQGFYPFEFKEGAVMDKDKIEHVKDAARVISSYCDVLAVRSSELVTTTAQSVQVPSWGEVKKDTVIASFAKYLSIPLINMESNVWHPCQGLADAMTIVEKLRSPRGKKYVLTWVYHPKSLPMATPNSQFMAACDLGMDVTIVQPEGWELDQEILEQGRKRAKKMGGNLSIEYNQEKALKGAKIVCAKSWGSIKHYGNWKKEEKKKKGLKNWNITAQKMKLTDNGYFIHCLPVRRNVEVEDKVIDGQNSAVFEVAENRLWTQMALLLFLFSKK